MSQMFQYEAWSPFEPDILYTVDDFIDDDIYTKKGKLNEETLLPACVFLSGASTVYSVSAR